MLWTFYDVWNKSLETREEKEPQPRENIWAGEVGGAFIDRYLKMNAEKPTNPPNPRTLRKFEAGNIWEKIVAFALSRAGILIDAQKWVSHQYPELLQVTGKLDFKAGGLPDYEKAKNTIQTEFNWLPESISKATLLIVEELSKKYPNGLPSIILELKSCSSFMFELYEKHKTGSLNHQLQLFHYLKSENMPEGHIVYICKDDARMLEIPVYNPSEVENIYRADIEQMTKYIKNKEMPPKESCIIFDEQFKKFSANWKVGYSSYIKKIYGFPNQNAFDEKYKKIVEKWNRVLTRVKDNAKMTDNNLEAIKEMENYGFDINKIKSFLEK